MASQAVTQQFLKGQSQASYMCVTQYCLFSFLFSMVAFEHT